MGSEMGLEGWEVEKETRFKIKLGLGYICAKMNSTKTILLVRAHFILFQP
jgi:hypothetical protein